VGLLHAHGLAREESSVEVELNVDATLSLNETSLRTALSLRLPPRMQPYRLRVRRLDEPLVELEIDGRRRVLELADPRSARAIRELAIAAADLAHAPLVAAEPEPPAPVLVSAPEQPAPRSPPAAAPPIAELALIATVGAGSNLDAALGAGLIDASIRLRGPLRVALGAGFGGGPRGAVNGASADRMFLPAHAWLAWRFSRLPIELRLGGAIETSFLRASASADETSRVAVGGGPSAAAYFYLPPGTPSRRRVRALVGGGTDVFVNRTAWSAAGRSLIATERALFWVALGASFRVGR